MAAIPVPDPRHAARGGAGEGRGAEPGRSAARLPVPSALPLRDRRVQQAIPPLELVPDQRRAGREHLAACIRKHEI